MYNCDKKIKLCVAIRKGGIVRQHRLHALGDNLLLTNACAVINLTLLGFREVILRILACALRF